MRPLASVLACALLVSCGGGGGQSSPPPDPPQAPNRAPAFTSAATAQVDDDSAGAVYQAAATDPDGNALIFSLAGGSDQGAFRITQAGALSFVEPANFEAPADSNGDNIYSVRLGVSDGITSAILDLVVTVADSPVPTATSPPWTRLVDAPWQPRDSAGEAVLRGQLLLMGGWIDSFQPALRDVWASPDGVNWSQRQAAAPWRHSDLPMSIAFNDRVWIMGGYDRGRLPDATASNAVWSSADGATWTAEGNAGWSPRLGATIVEFQGRMWVIGGVERYFDGTPASLRNDVWSSADGRTWREETRDAPWPARAFHNALVFNGRIYLFGGGNYEPAFVQRNDVWSSGDGVNWRRETARAEWLPRIWASALVYRDRMWLLGGHGRLDAADPASAFNLNDVWTSTDGARWTKVGASAIWNPRHEMSAYVLNDRMFIAAGFDGSALKNDVWSLMLP